MNTLQRAGVVGAALSTMVLTFAAGVAVGRGTPDPSPTAQEPHHAAAGLRLANADLRVPDDCATLLDWYVRQGLRQVSAWGWGGGIWYAADGALRAPAPTAATGQAGSTTGQTGSATGTNVQEAGVDEPDGAKTDGTLLVRVHDHDLLVYDLSGTEPALAGSVSLPDVGDPQLLLAGSTVVVLGTDTADLAPALGDDNGWSGSTGARVLLVDVSRPESPVVTRTTTYDAGLLGARQHGDVVRLTLSSPLPDLDFRTPGPRLGDRSALAYNRKLVQQTTLRDWLPQVMTDGAGARDLLGCSDVALPEEDAGLGTLSIVGFDVTEPEAWHATAVAIATTTSYESADRLVLATTAGWGGGCFECRIPMTSTQDGTTRLYAFALDGPRATYVASGQVDGAVADRWAMDVAGGTLRLAVGPTQQTGDFNSLVVLREEGSSLVEVGRVDKLGVGEQIRSVRWFDDLAIVVTFRQVDPLYAVDLGDPSAPRLVGRLKIPGFSEYLHPLGGGQLLGLGQDADAKTGASVGAQAALFDVTDLTRPRRTATVGYAPQTQALAGLDPRQFTWLPDRQVALTVISKGWEGRTGWLSVLTVRGGALTNRMIEVDYGTDVDRVRTLPLPDGRVVLVTGDAVSFLAV